jgi:hypothetical protein
VKTRKVAFADGELELSELRYKTVRAMTLRGHFDKLATLRGFPNAEQQEIVLDLVYASAVVSKPDITKDWLEETGGFSELPLLVPVIFELSGFTTPNPNAQSPAIPTSDGSLGDSAQPSG